MLKQAIMLSVFGVSMTQVAIPAETFNRELVKMVDKPLRMKFLAECKAMKQKNCHMKAFELSVRLQEKR
jgi:hypothetical protein